MADEHRTKGLPARGRARLGANLGDEGGPAPERTPYALAIVAGLAVVVAGAFVARCSSPESDPAGASASASASSSAEAALPLRCAEVAPGKSFAIGEPPAPRDREGGTQAEPLDRDELLAPFALVLGRASATRTGWAMGALGDGEGGTIASVVTVDAEAGTGRVTRMLRSRADFDPPVVVPARDGRLFVAMLEPNASGRSIRLIAIEESGGAVWGSEIVEGRDDSLALDVALSEDRGVLAWDALDGDRSFVAVAGFPLRDPNQVGLWKPQSREGIDADAPRVVARPEGFFLAYLAHGVEVRREEAAERGDDAPAPKRPKDEAPAKRTKTKKPAKSKSASGRADRASGEVDEAKGGEGVGASWLEVALLDAAGARVGEPLRVTPENSNVVSFDVGPGAGGSLLVAWRDEDSPTGAAGGPVRVAQITSGGLGEARLVASELPADGAPSLLEGWLALSTLRGPDLLGRLGPDGALLEDVLPEPSLGRGEPIAARGDRLLLAEPDGKAMRLRVVACGARPALAPSASASAAPSE